MIGNKEMQMARKYFPRQYTDSLLELIEDGILDKDTVIMACLKYMSDDQVRDMAEANEFFPEDPADQ